MSKLMVLMYHGLYRGSGQIDTIDPEDRPYAVTFDEFRRQLDVIASSGTVISNAATVAVASNSQRPQILLTFDDGHESNHSLAFPELKRRGWSGTFFVTSDFIGQRAHFCNWEQLKEMSAGEMAIGSHGKTHRFLDALSDTEQVEELVQSNAVIGAYTGAAVDCISFPGGRFDRRTLAACNAAGLRYAFTSRVGANSLPLGNAPALISRIAVRATTTAAGLESVLRPGSSALRRAVMLERCKRGLQKTLGNRLYHALYRRVET